MHRETLSETFRAALRGRRDGRERLFGALCPSATALLVIDMQCAFVDAGSPLGVAAAQGIVPNINRLARAMRDQGSTVFWIRSTFTDRGRGSWPLYFDSIAPAGRSGDLRSLFRPGAAAHAFWPALEREACDQTVDKDRFSALAAGASDLDRRLSANGIDTLVITGTLTNVCCESTMRDAMMRDYRAVLVEDANAAQTDREHVAALENAARYFGDVLTTEDVLESLSVADPAKRIP